ncbi:hypothetical protein [Zooshikella ganghwensis]|nr:hypothetical protein [Zooshikella ganghwensis]
MEAHLKNRLLSPRQTQFAFLALQGKSDKEMGKELSLSHEAIRQEH